MTNDNFFAQNLFDQGKQVKKRYEFLMLLVEYLQPVSFLEVGTWKGERSSWIARKLPGLERFVGFDFFESGTEQEHIAEKTINCQHAAKQAVRDLIMSRSANKDLNLELVEGNTQVTLPAFLEAGNAKAFDFVFMDGGHSLETIASDWKYCSQLVKDDGVVVLDDYHFHHFDFGCRPLVDSLIQGGEHVVRFYPMIETLKSNNQMTMVCVQKKDFARELW